jgi:DNA-binding NtrC family response regulator
MSKIAPKSTRPVPPSQGKILCCESDANILAAQSTIFERAGYTVERAHGRKAAEQALRTGCYDVVILGHTLTRDDRHHLPYIAKKSSHSVRVMVLHASGKHPAVDFALDSRDGDKAVLAALSSLMHESLAVAV